MRTGCVFAIRLAGLRLAVLVLAGLLAACSKDTAPWGLRNVSGLMPPLDFTLTDASNDATVHGKDFHGKVVLLYFGYTHCPDVCPTTLALLGHAVAALGKEAAQVRVLFVSVDPARDTLAHLKTYAAAFGPQVVGLRGSEDELKALTKRYRVTFGYGKPDAHGNYEVSHSSAVYVFDRTGEVRLLADPSDNALVITTDLQRLLKSGA